MLYAEIAIPRPITGSFTYLVPERLIDSIKWGQRVLVPFHNKDSIGYVIEITKNVPPDIKSKEIKAIKEILDPNPVFSMKMKKFLVWISSYYCASLGEVCRMALPNRLNLLNCPKTSHPLSPPEMLMCKRDTLEVSLNNDQKRALEAIKKNILSGESTPILLHGVTGSGKTEVYLRAFKELKRIGGQGLLLVPEISLAPQFVQVFTSIFGDEIAVYHSALTDAQRHMQWENIRQSKVFAVIGTRSALFAPFSRLKLIIVDEEHDSSYKQDDGILYHARNAAVMRAKIENSAIVLGSATPSFESFYNACIGKYLYFELPKRATGAALPQIEIIDMRKTNHESKIEKVSGMLSETLINSIEETLKRKEQILIFLNRRGFSNFLLCADCGHIFLCPNCDISLTHHLTPKRLICHYCDYTIPLPDICPQCRGFKIKPIGCGTEKIEHELHRLFPNSSIVRLDRDTSTKAISRKTFLSKMQRGEIDILVGTQLITKGHDFPSITLVGVVNADISLYLPDFRSFERTYQILTQVSGRAGRGNKPGKVIIQTYQPEHPTLLCVKSNNFASFFEIEKDHRQKLKYPPFARLAIIRFMGNSNEKTQTCAKNCFIVLSEQKKAMGFDRLIELLGPAPAPLQRVRNKFRWHILIKSLGSIQLSKFLNASLPSIKNNTQKACKVVIDVDPINML